jgi:hypothetical protein
MDNIDPPSEFDCPELKRCCQAWYQAYQKAEAAGAHPVSVRLRANEAYRYAMPPLNCPENIPGFVSCVVHGMMLGAIIDELGTRWLYAAQVASSLFKSPKASKSMNQKDSKPCSSRKTRTLPPPPPV